MRELYCGARFTVVPSLWPEPFGLVATEAMSYGLPVIAARSGALPEIIEHEYSGLLYEPRNAGELASHMERLWRSPRMCEQLGANARQVVRDRYDSERYYSTLLLAFEQAVRNTAKVPSESLLAVT